MYRMLAQSRISCFLERIRYSSYIEGYTGGERAPLSFLTLHLPFEVNSRLKCINDYGIPAYLVAKSLLWCTFFLEVP